MKGGDRVGGEEERRRGGEEERRRGGEEERRRGGEEERKLVTGIIMNSICCCSSYSKCSHCGNHCHNQ
jgi:hypothetical protein